MRSPSPRVRLVGVGALAAAAAAFAFFAGAVPASAAETAAAIRLEVDAREAPRKILHAKLVIPAAPGPLTLLYPKWLPGEHGPTGPIADLAGLKITAAGRAVPWTRDPVEMYAFHCDVPAGASSVEVALDYLAPASSSGFSSAASATTQLAVISWNQVLVYPKGASSDAIRFSPSLRLPAGWSHATSLDPESGGAGRRRPALRDRLLDHPRRLPRSGRRALPLDPPRRQSPDRLRSRRRAGARHGRQDARRVQEPGRGNRGAVRHAPLPPLRLPAHALRPGGPFRPRAPRVE